MVEIVLLELFFYNAIPKIMTFEGWNFDILAGISALFVYYFGFIQKRISYRMMLVWNIVALGLLVTIVLIAALSMPSPIQSFGFTQPNIAIFFFPYVWLPSFVVPVVLFSHIVSIRQILTQLQK